MRFTLLQRDMDEVFTKIVIDGGNYNSQQELKKLILYVKCSLKLMANDGVGVKITQHKKFWKKCNGARGIVTCRNHEDAVSLLNALNSHRSLFHSATTFTPVGHKVGRPRTFHPRYTEGRSAEQSEQELYQKFKQTASSDINIYA